MSAAVIYKAPSAAPYVPAYLIVVLAASFLASSKTSFFTPLTAPFLTICEASFSLTFLFIKASFRLFLKSVLPRKLSPVPTATFPPNNTGAPTPVKILAKVKGSVMV